MHEYQNEDGESKALVAEWPLSGGIQHECDHLDGKLFISKMSKGSRYLALSKYQKKQKMAAREARRRDRELKGIPGVKPKSRKKRRGKRK